MLSGRGKGKADGFSAWRVPSCHPCPTARVPGLLPPQLSPSSLATTRISRPFCFPTSSTWNQGCLLNEWMNEWVNERPVVTLEKPSDHCEGPQRCQMTWDPPCRALCWSLAGKYPLRGFQHWERVHTQSKHKRTRLGATCSNVKGLWVWRKSFSEVKKCCASPICLWDSNSENVRLWAVHAAVRPKELEEWLIRKNAIIREEGLHKFRVWKLLEAVPSLSHRKC